MEFEVKWSEKVEFLKVFFTKGTKISWDFFGK